MNEQNLASKQSIVSEISEKIKTSESTIIVEYRGLKVSDITELRRQLRAEGVDFKVYKNSLSQRAAVNEGFEELVEALKGPNAMAFSDDAIAPSRVLAKFAKKNKQLILKSGIVEGKVVNFETIKELAELPNREGLLSMFVGMLQSPMSKFAYALSQIAEQSGSVSEEEVTETIEEVAEVEATVEAEEKVIEAEVAPEPEVVEEVKAVEEVTEPEAVEAEVAEVEETAVEEVKEETAE